MIMRALIAFELATSIILCLYLGYIKIIYICATLAVFYDMVYLKLNGVNIPTIITLLTSMIAFNTYTYKLYCYNPYLVLKIIIICQMSDIYQYVIGVKIGKNKIGWLSKNKTYEGYILGLALTIITFIYVSPLYEICTIYLLGVFGGLCSSLIKRMLNIKDYSNLLGPHGGWIDRIDSIIFPLLKTLIISY